MEIKVASNKLKSLYQRTIDKMFSLGPSIGMGLAVLATILPVLIIVTMFLTMGSTKHPSEYSVKITNFRGSSGGSGVMLSYGEDGSVVLTNKHVCGVLLEEGGQVISPSGFGHAAVGIIQDNQHDLCLVKVAANLGSAISIAEKDPEDYEKALITGHPQLLPNLLSEGQFGGRLIIGVVTKMKDGTRDNVKNEGDAMSCILMGGIPEIKQFESRVVSSLIMPGSSGSPVLNSKGELAGLVFAGNAQGLSYAFTVPLEAIKSFLRRSRASNYPWTRPWDEEKKISQPGQQQEMTSKLNPAEVILLKNFCKKQNKNEKIESFCKKLLTTTIGEML